MRFFGIDKHISCVSEFRWIANKLGHTYQDMCDSGHGPMLGMRLGLVGEVAGDAWCNMYREKIWDVFAEKYGRTIEKFDAVVCGYPPLYAWLYKKIDVPIIVNIPIRYEHGVDGHEEGWLAWNEYLREGVDSGKIILVANNKYDQVYTEAFLDRDVEYIPVVGDYTGATYNPLFPQSIYYAVGHANIEGNLVVRKHEALQAGHSWQRVAEFRSVTWLPYNVSIMSVYEQYAAGIPLNFPSRAFGVEMHSGGICFTQSSWAEQHGEKSSSLVPMLRAHPHDPNNYRDSCAVNYWLQYADAYNGRLDGVTLFDSIGELNALLCAPSHALRSQSNAIRVKQDSVRLAALNGWSRVFDRIKK